MTDPIQTKDSENAMHPIAVASSQPVRPISPDPAHPPPNLTNSTESHTARAIPYYNILSASLTDLTLEIYHALLTSKTSCRPACISYTLGDKTSLAAARSWLAKLLDNAYGNAQRSKRIKVLVNPFGGKGAAEKLFAKEIEPIFRAARCEIDAETTRYQGHAEEIAQGLDIEHLDVVACCSGDGLPHEVFNGLAKQPRPRRALRRVAVVQLPCGSGNAMSLNLNGTASPSLAALAVVKGLRTPMDLVAITQGERRYWSFLSQAVGIVAESDLGTENIRWMGSARFTVGFLIRLLGQTVYPADVSVKVEMDDKATIKSSYARTRSEAIAAAKKRHTDGPDHDADSQLSSATVDDALPPLRYGSVTDPVPADWLTTSMPTLGNFYAGNMAWMSSDAPFFPSALPADSLLDLVNIDGLIPRLTAVKASLAVENNTFFDLPYVSYRKVTAYRITPRLRPGQKEGYVSIDGERVAFQPFQAEVVPALGTVLSRSGAVFEFPGPRGVEAGGGGH